MPTDLLKFQPSSLRPTGWRCGVVCVSEEGYENFEEADAQMIAWLNPQLLEKLASDDGVHPDKTFIGKTERAFDFLGVQFHGLQRSLSKVSLQRLNTTLLQKFQPALGFTSKVEYKNFRTCPLSSATSNTGYPGPRELGWRHSLPLRPLPPS